MGDGDRAEEHRLCLRRSLCAVTLKETPGPWAPGPCTQGWRRHHRRIETSTGERENKLPTSNLHPVPATSTAHRHPPWRERKPQAHTSLRGAQTRPADRRGAGAPASGHTPLPTGASLTKGPASPAQGRVPPATHSSYFPESHVWRKRQGLAEPRRWEKEAEVWWVKSQLCHSG